MPKPGSFVQGPGGECVLDLAMASFMGPTDTDQPSARREEGT